MNYTQDQLKALELINKFLVDKSQYAFLLNGKAGCGKTSLISKITEEQFLNARRCVVGAFTNKATNVIGKKNPYATKMTLFKLLSLKAIEESEVLQFRLNFDKKENNINYFDLIVIDECSQLENEHVNLLLEKVKEFNKKVILVGDDKQLPPISQKENSCSFDITPSFELKEIVRQSKNSDIPIYASHFRDIIDKINEGYKIPIETKIEYPESHDIHFYETSDVFIEQMINDFNSEEYRKNSDYVKVIGYRNNTINKVNDLIRKSIFEGQLEPLMIDERLVLNAPAYDIMSESNINVYDTSDEIQITEILRKSVYDQDHYGVRITFPYCTALVKRLDDNAYAELHIVYPAFKDKFEEMVKLWAKKINGQKKIFKYEWYPFIKRFTCPSYSYAITSHKSQSATNQRVYVLEDDIDQVKKSDILTLWKSKYVACTRASEQLHILNRIKERPIYGK